MSKLNEILLYFLLTVIASATLTVISPAPHCIVREHDLGFVHNLTQLSSNNEDIFIEHPTETIRMQLCFPLKKKCNNQDGYAICLIKNGTEKGIGRFPPQVVNDTGRILFNYTGDICLSSSNYTVLILMKCDYSAKDNLSPELFSYREGECNLFIVWKTAFACGPRTQTNCTIVNNNQHYDLSPLTRYSDNYVIHIGNETSPKLVLNVCHSVIRQRGSICPVKTGICLDDPKRSNRYSSLGEVQESPFFTNGRLQIEYKNGGICSVLSIVTPHIKTTIIFICDLEAKTETTPEYLRGQEECHYRLIWRTAAACSVEALRDYSAKTAGKCTVTNPLTNFTYNLQPLMNKDFIVTSSSDIEYKFRICGSLTDNTCGAKTGVCDSKHNASLGQANANLIWQQGGPYLNYTNGKICSQTGMRHYTIIGFFCGPEGSTNAPFLMEDNPCQTVIHWNRDLVCEKRLKCATDNDDEINLTPLIQSTNNYVVKINDTEFHINICRPLVPTRGLTCTHGSAACKISVTAQGEYTNEISLGFPVVSPTLNKDLRTTLHYLGGSECPDHPTKSISSNFTFICDDNNQKLPVYKSFVDCTYMFEWKTSIACGAVMGSWTPPCAIKDGFLSHEYDLSLLHKNQQIHYVKGKQGKEYGISICGGEKYCNGSAVCHENNGYGSLGSVIFDYSRNDIKLKYTNGSKCNNNSYSSEVRFICDESMGVGTPKLLLESQCSVEFEWYTEVVCARHANSQNIGGTPILSREDSDTVKGVSSYARTMLGVGLIVIVLFTTLLYLRHSETRACFRTWTNIFSFRRGAGRVQYCQHY
ncbi:cation-independent mannose-6-phosphate receptor isoform X2 [Harpegnathos saltator]|uniref:cation-independent mannose-6-phosphate receptor isoform X2 n=1 Tax=Harpegnathos saltator TaxID=610380 RepID=UPI00058FAA75|nr:cation-independent mannose-6-phosphate receptor isoform X2 [Harpegnathos saltator]